MSRNLKRNESEFFRSKISLIPLENLKASNPRDNIRASIWQSAPMGSLTIVTTFFQFALSTGILSKFLLVNVLIVN